MNQVSVFGRFTRDPEMRYTQQGKAVCNFSLAVDRFSGKDDTDFFECVAWEKQAENIMNSCKKGHRLLVWGRIQQERWTDQQSGQNRSTVKIVLSGFSFIEPAPSSAQGTNQNPPAGQTYPNNNQGGYTPPPGAPGYVPPSTGNYPPPGSYPPPGGQYGQTTPPAGSPPPGQMGQYGQPTGAPTGQPTGQQNNWSGNTDDIPF